MAKKDANEQKSFLSLPRLRAGHGIAIPLTNEWTENEQALSYVSRNIDVQHSAERGHSIPDIFSQSVQFEFELSAGNPAAIGAWQGLLATLLLAGSGGLVRVRALIPDDLPDSPFVKIFRPVAGRRGVKKITLFELKRPDGTYSAVAFRFDGMPTMLCPAAEIHGPFAVEDPWIAQTETGYAFTAPDALREDARYHERRVALRNEIYALQTRSLPIRENRDGVQLQRLTQFFQWLTRPNDGISGHPINAEVRGQLYTLDPSDTRIPSEIFTDQLCLFQVGGAFNHLHAVESESMRIYQGQMPTEWYALLPLRAAYAKAQLARLRAGAVRVRMQWHNGAVDAELLDQGDQVLERKRYHLSDLVNFSRHRNAPQLAVWPPKSVAGWNRYYLLSYDDGNALPLIPHVLGAGEARGDVVLLSKMPQGIAFTLGGEEAGVLMPAYETMTPAKTRQFALGFDFGTTGTTAYKHDLASGVTSPVSFAGEGALFLFGRQDGAEIALTAQLVSEMIAGRATHYTLLRRKTEAQPDGGALVDTTIPFLTSAGFNPQILSDVSDNLKWGVLPQDKLRAHLFLEQYLMMCLWHAVENGAMSLHWRASYPLAMHGRLQEEFIAKIQTIVSSLCEHCFKIAYDAYFCSESEAVGFMMMDNGIQARYLKGQTINDNTGFFCLDIGGGSTDLSLWLKRKPLMQASLRLAGNAILCETITRENHGDMAPARLNLIDFFFTPGAAEGKSTALSGPLVEGRYDEFRRVWNVLVDEITDAIKGLHRGSEPLSNYLNIIRMNLYMMFYFAGRMTREAIHQGAKVGLNGTPLPVAVLGNGAKMMKLLYNDVELIKRPLVDGAFEAVPQERRNESRYQEEMEKLLRAFKAGCGIEGFEAVIIEPFMPKQEAARGLALAPEAFLMQRAGQMGEILEDGWPMQSAFEQDGAGIVQQDLTGEFRELMQDSFAALRQVFGKDEDLRAFLASLFPQPMGESRFNVEAYYEMIWTQCLRHNPEPMLPGQPLPQVNTIAGRFVEMIISMNRMMRTA